MTQDELKKLAAESALAYIKRDMTVGIGTGSTVNHFIAALVRMKHDIGMTVASSIQTEQQLKQHGIEFTALNNVGTVDIYIDGADEANTHHYLIKGLGGALTREKVIASAAKQFICIIDQSKKVDVLGNLSPVPVEVIPMARSYVAREIVKMGADPVYREGIQTDNGNQILDVHNLKITDPVIMEKMLNNIPGVVENGIFAKRPADVIIMATPEGIRTI
ncbi:MAG: rpiA [Gammaproteobacteria bacterium]|jgi:ribose 5-phosphate isomerase A|nr:rpiA [Gammaproteobacteria bacterium]